MDEGPIIVQAAVPIFSGDDATSLEARVLTQEHLIYPLALQLIGEGKVRIEGERAIVNENSEQLPGAMINPAIPMA